ncbi:MAG: efflux RND transporter periplasmic adaptor subunit [Bacteroidetes bacterium]|nr:MAG: efflux RND transporter periplasmic adaptor subunit [Bacteroidota bacterium]
MKRRLIIISGIIIVSIIVVIFIFRKSNNSNVVFKTTQVERGDISTTITATGTLEAITTVQVGTQVSGVIRNIAVDFNSIVKKGQLIAMIDTTTLAAAVLESKASLARNEATLTFNKKKYNRIKELFENKVVPETDYDEALNSFQTAKANYMSAKAQLNRALTNLRYATITAPINGVVISRNVDIGQTVAASFNTPTLFTIANDLSKMQVEASIDEADIGQVEKGQKVEFTVDAYPDLVFKGKIIQKRLQPIVVQNVVTYNVIIDAPNPSLKLMPGMTANIVVYVKEKHDVLKIKSKALRYNPTQEVMKSYFSSLPDSDKQKRMSRMKQFASNNSAQQGRAKRFTKVWVKNGENIKPKRVKTGENDGENVEIIAGLELGDSVIIGQDIVKNNNSSKKRSPFLPSRHKKK